MLQQQTASKKRFKQHKINTNIVTASEKIWKLGIVLKRKVSFMLKHFIVNVKQRKADLQMMNNQELCFNYEKIMML